MELTTPIKSRVPNRLGCAIVRVAERRLGEDAQVPGLTTKHPPQINEEGV